MCGKWTRDVGSPTVKIGAEITQSKSMREFKITICQITPPDSNFTCARFFVLAMKGACFDRFPFLYSFTRFRRPNMRWISFRRYDNAAGKFFITKRIRTKSGKWTPFIRVKRRYQRWQDSFRSELTKLCDNISMILPPRLIFFCGARIIRETNTITEWSEKYNLGSTEENSAFPIDD